jgi:hypothetical protein
MAHRIAKPDLSGDRRIIQPYRQQRIDYWTGIERWLIQSENCSLGS